MTQISSRRHALSRKRLLGALVVVAATAVLGGVLGQPGTAATLTAKFNFQPAAATIPAGYVADSGAAYGDAAGFGWVTQASLSSSTHTPIDISPNTRDRNIESDQRLDTIIHMQYPPASGSATAVKTPAAWEYALPNGTYTVTVAVGDPLVGTDPENHVIHVEGVTAIAGFVPSGPSGSSTRHLSATVTTTVADGKLTIDAIGGTNTKLDYVDIASASGDTTPPAAPANVTATPGDGQVSLAWTANTEADLAGYNVYRSASLPVPTTAPVNGANLIRSPSYLDVGLTNGTTYYYVVEAVDTSGNKAAATAVSAVPKASTGGGTTAKINFQPAGSTIPAGYVVDSGSAYSDTRGFGWVTQDSLSTATHVPLDVSPNARDRNLDPDQRFDTLIHMQYPTTSSSATAVKTPAAWEYQLPNGSYSVTVGAGDPLAGTDPESEVVRVEGNVAISNFVPSGANGSPTRHTTGTVTVQVSDGKLTVDAIGGTNTKLDYVDIAASTTSPLSPTVTSTSPANGATNIARNVAVTAEVSLPNVGAGIDETTLTSASVRLTRTSDNTQVGANLNTSGGGDVIVLQPTAQLDANTSYRFDVTSGLKDLSGAAFTPFSATFTTGTLGGGSSTLGAAFDKVALSTATGKMFTSLVIGPDGKLYAGTLDGEIDRFAINADGTLGTAEVINSIKTANGGARSIIGMAFDPNATATNPILWVSNNYFWTGTGEAPDWSDKITRLSGAALGTVQDYVVGLPRSIRDHETNSIAFGPDGALYVAQGSNSSMGAPDTAWGNRAEHPLTAAVLRVNLAGITSPPLNVQTSDGGGTYNPLATGAPVTVYASGLRNAYDLVWHSNGQLYAPTNGSATGGNTPATPASLPSSCTTRIDSATNGAYTGPQVPGLASVSTAQDDFLFRVAKGGYYGHPDPLRCEWVLNGGNPTAGVDPAEVTQYPVGTAPDRNWRGSAFDFGLHYSPDGAIEYKSTAFGSALKGKLLVTRYSAGDDIIVLTPGPTGDITSSDAAVPGLSGFVDPLDLVENTANGNLYVTELGAQRITLLRPTTGAKITVAPNRLIFNGVQNAGSTAAQTVTVSNTGTSTLTLSGLSIAGANPSQFQISSQPALPASIAPGATVNVGVVFTPTSTGPKGAVLQLVSNDPSTPTAQVTLRGLGTLGLGGSNEPSLQWILDTFQIPVNVGDPDPTNNDMPATGLLGDEVSAQSFQKAGTGPITLQPIAVFGPQSSGGNVANVGWYITGTPSNSTQLFSVPNSAYQSLQPVTSGNLSFDPGATSLSFYTAFPFFSGRTTYGEDSLNTWEATTANRHKVRVYPLKATDGTVTPNAYIVALEDTTGSVDYNDVVFIVQNVKPVAIATPTGTTKVNFQPASAPVPAGYIVDSGQGYDATRGYGWVTQDSLSTSSHVALDLTPNTRDRNLETDQRLDTLIHMQYPPGAGGAGNTTQAAWELAVPNGSYTVTVGTGDPLVGTATENYVIHVEGVTAIPGYVPTGASGSSTRHKIVTVTVNVTDGRLTIDAIGGTNTKLDYVDVVPNNVADTTPPSVSVQLSGTTQSPGVYVNRATVTITASDSGGSGLASTSYSLDNGAFQSYTTPVDVTALGSHTIVGRATDGAGNITTTSSQSFSVVAGTQSNAHLSVQNMDGIPYDDWLSFNRIGSLSSPPSNGVHDQVTLRLANTGTDPLHVTGLPITGPWQLATSVTFPLTIAAGSSSDVVVKFVATSGRVTTGTLTVQSDDPTTSNRIVQLAGYWQSVSEGGQEPTLTEIINQIFPYKTAIVGTGQQLNQDGLVTAVGDEVLSPYWERADTTKPIAVRQLDAFHTQGATAAVYWFAKGSTSANTIFVSNGADGQSLLPHLNGSSTAPAQGSFTPSSPTFGFRVDGESSDDTLNSQTADQTNGCPGPCGHHVRFWPLKDRAGALVPDAWIMAMDYSGINYDYNDNVYLITNMKPAALYRLDVGGSANFVASTGFTWTPDTGLFSPSTAIAEPGDLPSDV
ncbi:MAG: large repetitive protein, partial [Gaiellaceae bacterium]|nr:large repetitive protein [Gaiellaceae bacterium]